MTSERPILLAAGGTGGHLFPAEALALVLQARGFPVELATDSRALKYSKDFPARAVHTLPSATPTGGSLFLKTFAAMILARGTLRAGRLIRRMLRVAWRCCARVDCWNISGQNSRRRWVASSRRIFIPKGACSITSA